MGESDSDQDPYAPPEAGLEVEESELGEVDLYRAFITGAKTTETQADPWASLERYLERFHRRDEVGGLRPGWHWPAFFVLAPWLAFRRMYLVLALYIIFSLILSALTRMFASQSVLTGALDAAGIVAFALLVLNFFIPAMFADTVYWWHTNRMIRRAKFADPRDQISWLRKKGGTSRAWVVVVVLQVIYFIP